MRPLVHPSIEDVTVEAILYALADPVRMAIYADIAGATCTQTCSDFLKVSSTPVPKSTLSQHFRALREAGLIRGERRGVEMHNTSRCEELEQRFPGLVRSILDAYRLQLERERKGKVRAARTRSIGR